MGFWNDLTNALPHKSINRARELQECEITSIIQTPPSLVELNPKQNQCEICKITPGSAFAKNIQMFNVMIGEDSRLSFHQTSPGDPDHKILCVCVSCMKTWYIFEIYHKQEEKRNL